MRKAAQSDQLVLAISSSIWIVARCFWTMNSSALKPKEYELAESTWPSIEGHVLSRDQLLDRVWGWDFTGGSRTVDVHVRWLREKIEQILQP